MSEWIPREFGPDKAGNYLVFQKGYKFKCKDYDTGEVRENWHPHSVAIGRLGYRHSQGEEVGELRWWVEKNVTIKRITHWMPLPEAPTDES